MEMEAEEHEKESLHPESENQKQKTPVKGVRDLLWTPINWFRMLSSELQWSFVVGVVIVYGISQGLSMGLSRISIQYYLKDDQKVQPSEAQVYFGIIQIPWIVKPFWGLLTDTLPVLGYRRKPYFVFAGLLGVISMLVLSLDKNLNLTMSLLALMAGSAGVAIADVTIDACVTQNSIRHPSLAGDMQSLCGLSSSVGALVGFSLSGFLVHLVGPKGVFGLLSIPPGLVVLVGIMHRESHVHNFAYKQVSVKLLDAGKAMWTTLKCGSVWRPCLYMYLSLALALNVREGMFYWYTDAKEGPSFSKEIVGSIFSIGAVGSLLGVLLYQNFFKNYPFRDVLFWTQLLYGVSGLLDLVLVLRINLKFGLPDYFFVVIDEAVTMLIGRMKWMPLLVLSSKLCPAGIEGTFFALLMSIDHVGMLSSTWAGGLLLHILNITRTQFENLWMAILIRSLLRIVPIALLFLIPRSDPLDKDMNPKISDFGMARLFGGDQTEAVTKRVVGTYGYMAPEYAIDGHFSIKSDVFSFGILLLETLSGKRSRGFYDPNHNLNLIGHAWRLWKEGRSLELIDEYLTDSCSLSEVLRFIHVSLLCVQHLPEDRPTMSSVVLMLGGESALPPPKKPGFFIGKYSSSEAESSSKNETFSLSGVKKETCSTIESSITVLEPR